MREFNEIFLPSLIINQSGFQLVYFVVLVVNLAIHQDQGNIKDFFNLYH